MQPPRMIYIFGIDGSGKSTICRELAKAIAERGLPSRCLWLRFNHFLSKGVNALGHLCGLAFYTTYPDGTRVGYHHYHKSRLLSFAYSVSTIIDTGVACLAKFWFPWLIKREVTLVDRFVFDVMVDLGVDTGNPEIMSAWQGRMLKKMLPADALKIFLDAGKEVILKRRPDTQWDLTFDRRKALYGKALEAFPGILKIDNNGEMKPTINALMGAIWG